MLICIRLVGRDNTRNRSANSAHNESSPEPTTVSLNKTGHLRLSPSPIGGAKDRIRVDENFPQFGEFNPFLSPFWRKKWTCFVFEHVATKLRSAQANYLLENAWPVNTAGRFIFTTYRKQMVASLQVRSLTLQV